MYYFVLRTLLIACFYTTVSQASAQDGSDRCRSGDISIATFNIQFLGHFKNKENRLLARILKDFDLVFVQELVAPPYPGRFPNGKPFKVDKEASAFFESMLARGFRAVISEEDTGSGTRIHTNSAATEWWVAFFKPEKIDTPCRAPIDLDASSDTSVDSTPVCNLPNGFLAEERADHDDFERVPYAFAFRFGGQNDAVFISTHLQPGTSQSDQRRRKQEITAIEKWIAKEEKSNSERDFIILGDMNIKDCVELGKVTPPAFTSLNKVCEKTNTTPKSDRPYDHVMYRPTTTGPDLDEHFGMRRVNLIKAAKTRWGSRHTKFPGEKPYRHGPFRTRFSDHHFLKFCMRIKKDDD